MGIIVATAQQLSDEDALWLGTAVLGFIWKALVFLFVLAMLHWALDMGKIVKNQRRTIELLEEIRDAVGRQSGEVKEEATTDEHG
jgi:hypothetical protein